MFETRKDSFLEVSRKARENLQLPVEGFHEKRRRTKNEAAAAFQSKVSLFDSLVLFACLPSSL